jgi:tRNA (adenine57-N1/adenine58-N1)-methyltransferase catalytic subunit
LSWNTHSDAPQEGDLVELVGLRHKHFILRLKGGANFESHRGIIKHDDLIGRPWGSQVTTHLGTTFFLMQLSLGNLLRDLKRNTQIMYPKEIGFVFVTMGIGPGQTVLEAGTGSGALTTALAFAVGPEGHVFSYDNREESQKVARANLEKFGLSERVTFKLRDIANGFDESGIDSAFLDVANPFDYMRQVRAALKPGGFFGSILPTTNQVCLLLNALRQEKFAFIDVCEVLIRYYKAEPSRFRPTDRMIAHTGFLIFARPVLASEDASIRALINESNSEGDI